MLEPTMLEHLKQHKIIAIVRGVPLDKAHATARALEAGGIRLLEVTLNTAGALDILSSWRSGFPDLLIGAGTVLTLEDAKLAIKAGAQYLVTPHTDPPLIEFAVSRGVPIFPGALTPSEVLRAHQAGAAAVKVFPAGALGGPSYLRELRGPLNHIPLIAVGGVNAENARAYLEAGAVGLGVGGALVRLEAIRAGDYAALTQAARALVAAVGD